MVLLHGIRDLAWSMDSIARAFRERYHVVSVDLLPLGASRRDWRQTLLSDGWLIVRHPDLQTTLEMADRIGTDLQLYAQ